MEEKRQTSHIEEFQTICVHASHLNGPSITPYLVKCGLGMVTSFQRILYGKRGKYNFRVEESGNQHSGQESSKYTPCDADPRQQ